MDLLGTFVGCYEKLEHRDDALKCQDEKYSFLGMKNDFYTEQLLSLIV
jgi:hypothetical protein